MRPSSVSNKKTLPNILLIDDEEALLSLNEAVLESDFEIFKALNLQQAKEILETYDISIIISDHFIGLENGLNFLITIKEQYPNIIKVLFTSCVSHEVMIESHNSQEIFRYLTKPCPNEKLLENAKLAQIAWQVLQIENQIKQEHGDFKELIGDTTTFRYKIQNLIKSCNQFYWHLTQNISYLFISILLCGTLLIVLLYSLKSILGIDIFK